MLPIFKISTFAWRIMPTKSLSVVILFIIISLFFSAYSFGGIDVGKYALVKPLDEKLIEKNTQHSIDSLYHHSLFFHEKGVQYGVPRSWVNKTVDFYILLGLVLFLGIVRFIDPKYLNEIWVAYFNTGFSGRALRDKIEQSKLPNVLMNIFFVFAFGCYIFYVFRSIAPGQEKFAINPFMVLAMVGGVIVIYVTKYFVIRFTGWAFDMKGVTDTYLFNVFLVNKILAMGLIPFTVIMAFQDQTWSSVAVVLSFIMVLALLISRYVKSWQVLGTFIHYSKFHFFTYLCASEIMPLAVLTKFLLTYSL